METMKKTLAANRKARSAMAVLIRDRPPTFDWGWFSREDPRMHLQTVDKDHRHLHYKVWLESRGRRVVQPEPGIPAKALKVLLEEIGRQRSRIEAHWASFMIKNSWLRARLSGATITLYAYPNTPNHFERTIEVAELIRDKETARKVTAKDVALNEEYAFLELFPQRDEANRVHEPLPELLWVD